MLYIALRLSNPAGIRGAQLRANGMSRILLAVTALAVALSGAQPARAADTVYVMRHLQKGIGDDPPLSARGWMNAQSVGDRLANSGIKAIFATPTHRAMQTGEPLAKRLGISITTYDPRDPAGLIRSVAAVDGAVLIVGHSNTVPDIVARLGGTPVALGEDDYGTIFVVTPGNSTVEQIVLTDAPERG